MLADLFLLHERRCPSMVPEEIHCTTPFSTWAAFIRSLEACSGSSGFDDPLDALTKVTQTSSVADSQSRSALVANQTLESSLASLETKPAESLRSVLRPPSNQLPLLPSLPRSSVTTISLDPQPQSQPQPLSQSQPQSLVQTQSQTLRIKLALVGQVPRSDPIQCIGRSADELSKRDLLVAVESVIGKTEKLVALDLESKGLCVLPSTKAVDAALFYKNDFRAEDGYQFDFVLISVMRNLGWTVEAKAIYEEMKGKRLFISRQLFLLVCDELLGIINWSDHLPGVVPSSPSRKPLVNFCISNGSLFWLLHSNHGSDRTPVDGTTRLKIAARAVRLHPIFHFSQLKQYRGDPAQVDTRVPIWLYPVDIAPDFEIIKLIRFEAEVSRIYPYRYFPKTPKSIILPLRDLGFIFFPKIKVYHSLSVREINTIKPSFIDDLDNELCRNFFDHIDDLLDFPMEDVGSGDSGGECNGFQGACWPPIVDALTGSTNTVLYGKNGDNTTSEFSTELSVPIQAALPQATPTRSSWQMYNRSVSGLAVCFSPLVRRSTSRNHHQSDYGPLRRRFGCFLS